MYACCLIVDRSVYFYTDVVIAAYRTKEDAAKSLFLESSIPLTYTSALDLLAKEQLHPADFPSKFNEH